MKKRIKEIFITLTNMREIGKINVFCKLKVSGPQSTEQALNGMKRD